MSRRFSVKVLFSAVVGEKKANKLQLPHVVLTRVWLVNKPCSVRQILQDVDPGVGEMSSKQRHHLNLQLLTRSSCHWHGHQP